MSLKKFAVLLMFSILCLSAYNSINVFSEEFNFKCETDPQLVQELHNELLQRKLTGLNQQYSSSDDEISLFSSPFGAIGQYYMPSTGDVKALVVPIEFKDEKFSNNNISNYLYELFFKTQDIENTDYKDLSVSNYFKKVSFNNLRLSGVVLPIYSAQENREYYADSDVLAREISKAITLNENIIGDLSEYDLNDDGYIDCLNVVWAGTPGGWSGTWWTALNSCTGVGIYNDKQIKSFVGLAEDNADTVSFEHEIGHALGLPDNYRVTTDSCILSNGTNELMSGDGFYINALYKYILDWEEPQILPYASIENTIDLYAMDTYDLSNKLHSVIFVPEIQKLPFTEFYIVEYRNRKTPGMIIWHCNTQENKYVPGTIKETSNYIAPIYKSNNISSFTNNDMYKVGDIWSADTTPSSNFYNDVYTGAYMEVLNMDEEKATVCVGFKDIDDIVNIPEPTVTIGDPSAKLLKKYSYPANINTVTIPFQVENFQNADEILDFVDVETTGDAKCDYLSYKSSFNKKTGKGTLGLYSIQGNGSVRVRIKEDAASNGVTIVKYSKPSNWSSLVTVDSTIPQIELIGDSEITVVQGQEYVELGANVTDNFELQENCLVINSSEVDVSKVGSYKVYYNATDKAGNKATQVIRKVNVVAPTKYMITFKNHNGDILQSGMTEVDKLPEYVGETPQKPSDDKYTYTFSGWSPELTAVTDEATYTAQFTAIPRKYTVTLNANNGVIKNNLTEYTYGSEVALPTDVTKVGYIFGGWYDNAECSGTAVKVISSEATGNKTYYANWIPQTYTVTYNYNGAASGNTDENKSVVYNNKYGTLPSPAKVGYVFDGWYLDDTKIIDETKVSTAENHTLTAKWTVCTHNWGNGTVIKNATCTQTGTRKFTCSICADTKTEPIALLPHTEVTDNAVEPTCETDGKTEGSHCSVCSNVIKEQQIVPAKGHQYDDNDWSITVKPSHTVLGVAERKCKNDSSHIDTAILPVLTDASVWTEGTRVEPTETADGSQEYISKYGTVTVVIPATGHIHDWGDWTIVLNPTEQTVGIAERICKKSGNDEHKETTTVPNLSDEIWSKGAYNAPTCTENGSQEYTSEQFGTVSVVLSAVGHTPVTDEAINATCETDGKTEGSHCGVCSNVIKEQQTIPMLGHDWGDWTITNNPTLQEKGTAKRICKNDNQHVDEVEVPELTNSIWTLGNRTEPTYGKEGLLEYVSEYGTVTVVIPPLEPKDRVEFTPLGDGTILARLVFDTTVAPPESDIQLFVAYTQDGALKCIDTPSLIGTNAIFKPNSDFSNCDINVYVWDKNMKPLMEISSYESP